MYLLNGLASHYAALHSVDDDSSPRFSLFCDDMRFPNMHSNRQFQVISVLDWEFTYYAPPNFLCRPNYSVQAAVSAPWRQWPDEDAQQKGDAAKLFVERLENAETWWEENMETPCSNA